MCGIAGFTFFKGQTIDIRETIEKMIAVITHRGPDERGVYTDDTVALGSRRLSIIDLASGRQPIHNEDRSLWIVFNGEIYNYPELRDKLTQAGHIFTTRSDTEVIVHLYEEYGVDCSPDSMGCSPLHFGIPGNRACFWHGIALASNPCTISNIREALFLVQSSKLCYNIL